MYVYCSDHTVALIEETKEFEGQLFLKRIALPFPVQPGIWVEKIDLIILYCARHGKT